MDLSQECTRCKLITAIHKMISNIKDIPYDKIHDIVRKFTANEITFREVGECLGKTEEDMVNFLPIQHLDRKLNE